MEDEPCSGRPCTSKTGGKIYRHIYIWPKWGLSWGLIEFWQSQWSVVSWIWITKQFTTFWPRNWACGHLDAASRLRSLSHCHLRERSFDKKKGISMVPQPPYSPDLSPCDFFLFLKHKSHTKSRYFGTVDNVQKVVTDQLRALPHEDFQHRYREWEQHFQRCVACQRNYFEEDSVDF
jgi:hypothetical protein